MATYTVYNNILIKLENVFLRVEMEVDKEIASLLTQHTKLGHQLYDLKGKIDALNSLKRSFDLYCDNEYELHNLNRALFKVLCDKQILLRYLQEKEWLLKGHLPTNSEVKLPTIIQINKEFKLRKRLQEIELLSSFLTENPKFEPFLNEINQANEVFDLAIESGATDKLESVITLFEHFFEKVLNLFDLDADFIEEFKAFRTQILLQANNVPLFAPQEIADIKHLRRTFKNVSDERKHLEQEVDKLLYQFNMFQNGKKIILVEIKSNSGELESILFKEYAVKQKIQELRQYKIELNHQKDSFMKDPTVDAYAEAVQQLESVEHRFRRLMMHKNFEKPTLASRFFTVNKTKTEGQLNREDNSYNKILFQVLHNNHISSQDKVLIFRLSKPSKLINTNSGKFFFQRTSKTRSLQNLEKSVKKLQAHEIH